MAEAKETANKVTEEGIDQAELDAAAAKGFGNALFEYEENEMTDVAEEFYFSPDNNQHDMKIMQALSARSARCMSAAARKSAVP